MTVDGRCDPEVYDLEPADTSLQGGLQLRVVVIGLMLITALVGLDGNIVNTALPRITSEFHGVNHMSWIITSFMLGQCAVMPVYGKLSDIYGRKPMLISAIVLFLAGSGFCGVSRSLLELACFRAVQGVGVGGVTVLTSTIVADLVAPEHRGRILGLFMGAFAASSLAGPLVGGAITSWIGWRWVFYINLPLGLLVIPPFLVPFNSPPRSRVKLDYLGALLLIAAATCFILTLSVGEAPHGFGACGVWFRFALFAALTTLLIVQEHRAPEPILAPDLFRNRRVVACLLTSVTVAFPFFGAVVFMPLYFQMVDGFGPLASGLAMTPQIVGLVVSSRIGGWLLARKTDPAILILSGVAGVVSGLFLIGTMMASHQNLLCLDVGLLVLGLGGGIVRPNLIIVAQTAAGEGKTGAATSTLIFVHTLSGTAGVACAQMIMNGRLRMLLAHKHQSPDMQNIVSEGLSRLHVLSRTQQAIVQGAYGSAIAMNFFVSGLVGCLGLLCALRLLRLSRLRRT